MARPKTESPLSPAERKRRQREREKAACHENVTETKPVKFDAAAKADEIYNSLGAADWDKETRRYMCAALLAHMAHEMKIADITMVFIMDKYRKAKTP